MGVYTPVMPAGSAQKKLPKKPWPKVPQVPCITLSDDQEAKVRLHALKLLKQYVPFKPDGSPDQVACYREVVETTGWTKTAGSGTTCGFLCHWLMWRLGVAEPFILNWNDPDRGAEETYGAN